MTTNWTLTVDCARPRQLAEFWALALGYETSPPPPGFATVEEWLASLGVPEEEWDDGAYLSDPTGRLPRLSFLKVPEPKVAKNRLHLDVQAGGGRDTPVDTRWPRVLEAADRLTAAGATVVKQYDVNGEPDHLLMTDPEGNEFCLL
jgi:hypothetical protein